ncbi:expressed unknown protein (Partial), partial [Seminavis robusta]|eukprot:Sro1617_g286280.1 n/a (445) ;mRNA; r:2-1337
MKRFFGFGKKKKKQKERLSPSELSTPVDGGFHAAATSPMYQYARNEFAQTVASGTSNDDGRGVLYTSPLQTPSRLFTGAREPSLLSNNTSAQSVNNNNHNSWTVPTASNAQNNEDDIQSFGGSMQTQGQAPTAVPGAGGGDVVESTQSPLPFNSLSVVSSRSTSLFDQQDQSVASSSRQRQGATTPAYQPPQQFSNMQSPGYHPPNLLKSAASPESASQLQNINNPLDSPTNPNNIDPDYIAACSASNLGRQESLFSQESSQYPVNGASQIPHQRHAYKNQFLEFPAGMELPNANYEEEYGDAYIGGPIRYVYPSGYQSMRPRSGPWKLSIVICLLFTWLSVFIVGHCSDRVDSDVSQYNQNEIDDDTLVIETRWCGSRLLYMMWVISMLVTGLAAAYCSIIGYIKVRDFAVANSRSQPPGVVGKSDFYAQIDDAMPPPIQETSS